MKQLTPVRMIRNKFFEEVQNAEWRGATLDELKALLGKARAKKGMFEGNLDEGELEIGQSSILIHDIQPAAAIVANLWNEFSEALKAPLHQL
jgi:enoyl-[acyl-carrier protein] reductase II